MKLFMNQLVLWLLSLSIFPYGVYAQNACNGYQELCNSRYSNVTTIGAHNSYAVGDSIAANQNYNVTVQLNDGIRLLQVQAHESEGDIRLCHSSCSLYDGGTMLEYLTSVKNWLDNNPNEVISILIVNANDRPISDFSSIYASVGMDQLSYVPESAAASQWPTLSEMINSGQRVVSYISNSADQSQVPYILDEFTYMWESPYGVTDVTNFTCAVDRNGGDGTTQDKMYLINHYLDTGVSGTISFPNRQEAGNTNSLSGQGSLGAHVNLCGQVQTSYPTFVLVDFYDAGDGSVFQAAAQMNGVAYQERPLGQGAGPDDNTSPVSSVEIGAGMTNCVKSSIFLPLLPAMAFAMLFFWPVSIV